MYIYTAAARLRHTVEQYGAFEKKDLAAAISRVGKRLGAKETEKAIGLLEVLNSSMTRTEYSLLFFFLFSSLLFSSNGACVSAATRSPTNQDGATMAM